MADVIITGTGGTGTSTYYDTDICNMALSRIGNADNYLTSTILTNNSTKEARLCNLYYKQVLKLALTKFPWKHAMVRDELTMDDEASPGLGYQYQYSLPDDCLIVVNISDEEDDINEDFKWTREGRYIFCDEPSTIYLTYITSDNTSDYYDAHFINYLVASLAEAISPSLVIDERVIARLKGEKQLALLEGAGIERREGYVKDSKARWEDAGRVAVSSIWDPAVHD